MKVAIKFDRFGDEEDGMELAFATRQMFVDIYVHERDTLPQLEMLESEWITRPDNEMFWVYRQGTFIDVDRLASVYVVKVKIKDLDAEPITFEGYHHVPTISLEGGYTFGGFSSASELISRRKTRDDLEWLYTHLVQYRASESNGG
jgi:hypothetical protein